MGFLALLIFGFVSIFALVPLLAHKVERYHTFAARETNICFKLSFFQVPTPPPTPPDPRYGRKMCKKKLRDWDSEANPALD